MNKAQKEVESIRKKLKHVTFHREVKDWLNTGSLLLNGALGSKEKGVPYGKMVELFGPESQGKTLIATLLAGLAQGDGADVGWVDLENSFDNRWANRQGLDAERVALFQVQVGKFGKEREERLQTAQELLEEVEYWMALKQKQNPKAKICVVVDSVAALLVEEEAEAGLTHQNMRTNAALSQFLSKMLRRWVALALNRNALIIFINQVRTNPGQMFGNPETTPGGKALKLYASIRCRVRRVKNGRLLKNGKIIGLKSIIQNVKNKAGEGSIEGADCGFKCFFRHDKDSAQWKFLPVAALKKEGGEVNG